MHEGDGNIAAGMAPEAVVDVESAQYMTVVEEVTSMTETIEEFVTADGDVVDVIVDETVVDEVMVTEVLVDGEVVAEEIIVEETVVLDEVVMVDGVIVEEEVLVLDEVREALTLPVWEPTGEPRVDAALDLLTILDVDDVSGHAEVFSEVHDQLRAALTNLDAG